MTSSSQFGSLSARLQEGLLKSIVIPPVEIATDGLTNFRWSSEGLRVDCVNESNSLVMSQYLPGGEFNHYDVQPIENDEIVFGTPCSTVQNLLKAAKSGEEVSLLLEESQRMRIEFGDIDYSLTGISPRTISDPEIPELDFDAKVHVHSEVLKRATQVVSMISESVKFNIEYDSFVITGRGDTDIARINVQLEDSVSAIQDRDDNRAAVLEEIVEPVESKYGTRLLAYINRFTPQDCLKTRLSEDYPMEIETSRGDGRISTSFVVAPRMSQE